MNTATKRVESGRHGDSPDYDLVILVTASGAMSGAVLDFGIPGAIVGALIGLWAGLGVRKNARRD